MAHVVVERELHVHVHDAAVGHQERVVGPARVAERRLLAVVDAFEQTREPQHVLGHALAPLAARLGARERLAQLLGVLGERGDALVLAPQLVAELAVGLALAAVERAHELAHLVELAGHRHELLVDQRLLAVELGSGAEPLLLEHGPVRLEQATERLVGGVALLVGEAGDLLGERPMDRSVGSGAGGAAGAGRRAIATAAMRRRPHS